jgi:Sas10/Utp3/C1D family
VKAGELATAEGLSYLEAKHLLLLSYCIHIVFYVLLKAEGAPVRDHPVIGRLLQLRTYLVSQICGTFLLRTRATTLLPRQSILLLHQSRHHLSWPADAHRRSCGRSTGSWRTRWRSCWRRGSAPRVTQQTAPPRTH